MKAVDRARQTSRLHFILLLAVGLVLLKTLLAILFEYRWYFPPDFDASAFLSGRRLTFVGFYPIAFYAHLAAGPFAIVFGTVLMLSGFRRRFLALHRMVGKIQVAIVLFLIVPSGLAMATKATTGPVAGWGFGLLSIATAICAVMAAITARQKRVRAHQQWAARCLVLLASPLLLRLISGIFIVADRETEVLYRLNAWGSWIIPLALYEVFWARRRSECDSSSLGDGFRFSGTMNLQRQHHERSRHWVPIQDRES